ncbi:DUF1858 domain-containing protein [candidate division KSB1 bacterium]|nr:DUF1858 domain-containing protein [candidate division KSB1 bacterium]
MPEKLIITPKTKIAELLEAYPQLQDILIEMAPQFKKLRNPVLRKTIARVTTLQQAAVVGNVPVDKLINELRKKACQEKMEDSVSEIDHLDAEKPGWFSEERIVKRLDARPLLEKGGNPLTVVLKDVQELGSGDIYELTTAFLPAPLIKNVRAKGYTSWSKRTGEEVIITFFSKEENG